ncbi:MAG: methionyl-tRNA formyltransferase [Paludibacteraceae bacterium]|mgnify:FL=1|nr:methionyl-tRNA formyltransferase [Paludibacteraceae bacterium]
MDKQSLRIIYMGTPDFAVESLRALVEGGYNVVAVVTMPDKPAGRGHQLQYSAVKQYALSVGLPLLQPERLKDEDFLKELRSYNADLQIVVAFRMLPEVVWDMPRLGTFNLHASLLPQYRGAAPINWAVMNGDTQTGATTFMLQHEIDTGNIILQESIDITIDENVGSVHDRLMTMGATLVTRTVDLIIDSENKGVELPTTQQQESSNLRPAPKIFKETCMIDFSWTAERIRNHVRGLSPYPAAWIANMPSSHPLADVLKGAKVYQVAITQVPEQKGHIIVPCADGYVDILELQLPGKKRMMASALLNGIKK